MPGGEQHGNKWQILVARKSGRVLMLTDRHDGLVARKDGTSSYVRRIAPCGSVVGPLKQARNVYGRIETRTLSRRWNIMLS